MSLPISAKLDRVAARYAAKPKVSSMSVAIEQPSTGFSWGYGDTGQPYFVASITKLYTTAMIMQLREENVLTLDTRVAELLGEDTMSGLNVHNGHDYGPAITVRELLAQTSGIPDYFEQKRPDGTTFLDDMLRTDAAWTFEDFIEMARAVPSRFAPSTPGKAQYGDTNYQLLGRIVEVATSGSYDDAIRSRIIDKLGLRHTWLFTPQTLSRYGEAAPVLHGPTPVHVPKAIASFPPDGAVVSTSADQVRLLRAFITGELFPAQYLTEMTAHWNPIFSRLDAMDYGIGIMRFKLPRWQSPFTPFPAMIGHSGAFGNVLYYLPERDVYVAATVNQMRPRSLAHRLLLRLVAHVR
ncbi:beta-lactamase family protein [Phytoactinopolyspora alkaliphila]|uniref:Beta-lactamase family protein n=1 Tax=Phytoactinopolyspora alkaliphila TaxID=1783498 RepID=A0A6N9YRZ2_9ACTN|nr:serine hydrolase domain-containing protein [Phytoactinopolyspora alkaliphila]NED97715.1 beta-lactamase family protein [Phytoactinopolyspora alkaliphila]